jgi:soluble lytic murein transglycosylase-like protein
MINWSDSPRKGRGREEIRRIMKKILLMALLITSVILPVGPDFEKGSRLEGSLSPGSGNETVKRAMVKSIRWADDEEIGRLVRRVDLKYGRHIDAISAKNDINPEEIKAIAIVESMVSDRARSAEGAIGLMGIKKGTGKDMGFNNVEHPVENLKAGTEYYKRLIHRFKDRELALAAYNLGPARLENRLGRGFDPQTMDYIWKIRRVLNIISRSDSGGSIPRKRG